MKAKFTNTKLKREFISWLAVPVLLFLSTIAFADFQYDGSGNIIQDDQHHYSYNDANRLSVVREGSTSGKIVAQYFYNHEGRRIKKIENGNTCYYINRSYQSCDDGDTSYYFLENERVAHKKAGAKTYYHNNHLGSPVALTNQQKATIERISYEPFGQTSSTSQYTYTGKEKDNTGDYYFEARYYDPALRQFKQTDPASPAIGDSFSLNPYTYARNNPLKYVDPDGRRSAILSFNQNVGFALIGNLNITKSSVYIISPEIVIDSAKAEFSSSGDVANSIRAGANAGGFVVKKQFHTVNEGIEAGAEVSGKYSVSVLNNLPIDGNTAVYGEAGGEVGALVKLGLKLRVKSQSFTSGIDNFSVKGDVLIFNAEFGSEGYEVGSGVLAGGSIGGAGRETTYETTGKDNSQSAEYIRSRRNN